MEFDGLRMEDDDNDEDDAAFQYMIEQSLLESSKKKEIPQEPPTGPTERSGRKTVTVSNSSVCVCSENLKYTQTPSKMADICVLRVQNRFQVNLRVRNRSSERFPP